MLLSTCALALITVAPPTAVQQSVPTPAEGRRIEYALEIGYEAAPVPPRKQPGLSVNGSIPGPTLRFQEGDHARITVRNRMRDQETSTHWHGLLLPNAMDGVPYLTTETIPPLQERVFEFELRHSGTYWYHSHTGLQEQSGVYGAIVVEPREGLDALHRELGVDREVVMVISDWTDEDPHEVMRTLMRGSDWYSIKKGNAQSLLGAWQRGKLGEYFQREGARMPAMDISDVAYDHFLVNGTPEARFAAAEPGERVLVRIVNAGASSYFHLTSAAGPLTIVASDGTRVQPVEVRRLLIGVAETYDVIVELPTTGEAIEVRATAHDLSGHAALVLGPPDAEVLRAEDPPAPDLYGMNEMLRAGLSSVSKPKGLAAATDERPFAPYALLRALEPTEIAQAAAARGVRTLTMRLTGDMQRYTWSINGKTLTEDPVVRVSSGEVVRIEFINDTMMHHPMHLHGHFFRVVTDAAELSPIKHTVDVPPMGKRTIEFIANEEPGDWFLHCHMLYHMDAGMGRVVSYASLGADHMPTLPPALNSPSYAFLDATFLTHMSMGMAMWMRGREDFYVRWNGGYSDSEAHSGAGRHHGHSEEREIDLGWSHYVDANLSTMAGYRFTNVDGAANRFFVGARYRLPYLVRATVTADDDRDVRVGLEKRLQITARGALFGSVEYDTGSYADWATGGAWTLDKELGLTVMYTKDHGFGVGVSLQL
ncbi:MAG: multicopper oxidase domain-containing protein [Planctomycetota bacterium]